VFVCILVFLGEFRWLNWCNTETCGFAILGICVLLFSGSLMYLCYFVRFVFGVVVVIRILLFLRYNRFGVWW